MLVIFENTLIFEKCITFSEKYLFSPGILPRTYQETIKIQHSESICLLKLTIGAWVRDYLEEHKVTQRSSNIVY